jgi:hypothetical protein
MSRDQWPPGGRHGEGREPHAPANVESSRVAATPPITTTKQFSGAMLWRDGFRRGALDALRLAARGVDDPDVWVVLDELAERYALAEGEVTDHDDYGLTS